MAMSREQFEAYVRRLEVQERADPKAYQLRLAALAGLGYAYVLVILALAIAALALAVWLLVSGHGRGTGVLKIILGLGVLVFILLRALWVSIPPPDGIPVTREQLPELFKVIDDLRARLNAPPFHRVLITPELNAAVSQVPLLGIFGWQRNYLVLGLQLMATLSVDEFRAVLAHEMGHLYGQHARFSAWIYRVNATWQRVIAQVGEGGGWGLLFNGFANWYAPVLNAYAFIVNRGHEYEADRASAAIAGAENAASALLRFRVIDKHFDALVWDPLGKRVFSDPNVPAGLYREVLAAAAVPPSPEDALRWTARALRDETGYADSHPSLADRLKALGRPDLASADSPRPSAWVAKGASAADRLLAPVLEETVQDFNATWSAAVAEVWAEKHQAAREGIARLAELDARDATTLSEEEAWDRARLTWTYREVGEALPLLRAFADAHPEHWDARFSLGSALLEVEDPSGAEHIETAMKHDHAWVMAGCKELYEHFMAAGDTARAKTYFGRAVAQSDVIEAAQEERNTVRLKDVLLPHGESPEVVQALVDSLTDERVREAWLVRKQVSHFPEIPLYVLAVLPRYKGMVLDTEKARGEMLAWVSEHAKCPGETIIIAVDGDNGSFKRPIAKVPGAQILKR